MHMNIYTIGYQGADLKSFLAVLKRCKIDTVADVRHSPHSRKKGFSKNSLRETLAENGIAYLGFPSLGVPKKMRDELKATGNYRSLFQKYLQLLRSKEMQINELSAMIKGGKRIALLCFEQEAAKCHRKVLAEHIGKLRENGFAIIHLNPF
jgi:uncharacterized protein (DUF488 family)